MSPDLPSYKSRTVTAIALIIFGYFCYSIADVCAKVLQTHYSVYQVLSISGFVGILITGIWLLTSHGKAAFFPPNLKLHLLRAVFVTGSAYFMVRALSTLPMADFYGIAFVIPFLVMILAVFVLNEIVGWRRWLAAAVGFSGVIVLAGPQFDNIGEGVVFALIGALCGAANIICLRKIGGGRPRALYGFYPFVFIFIFHSIGLFVTDGYVPVRGEDIPWMIVHGPVIVLGITTISMGFSAAPETSVVAPFHYTQIIWGVLFGWFFFHTMPMVTTYIGLAMIIGANLYSLWREYRRVHMIG